MKLLIILNKIRKQNREYRYAASWLEEVKTREKNMQGIQELHTEVAQVTVSPDIMPESTVSDIPADPGLIHANVGKPLTEEQQVQDLKEKLGQVPFPSGLAAV